MSRKTANTSRAPNPRIDRIRTAIVGGALVLAAVVFGIGVWYTTGSTGGIAEGTHYQVIEDAPPRKPGTPLLVQEVFSYACIHCRNFDPMIESWQAQLPEGVRFERLPATFSPAWTILAQTYFTLEELGIRARNHDRLFKAIHDTGRQFVSIEAVAAFVDGFGASEAEFLAAARGPAVTTRLRQAERTLRSIGITGVPMLIVDGRYLIGMNEGRKAALDTADHLIAQTLGAKPVSSTPSE